MGNGLSISFGFDKIPADGTRCEKCCEVIAEGFQFVPYVTVGDATDVKCLPALCEKCFDSTGVDNDNSANTTFQ